MPRIPKREGVAPFSSTFTLAIFSLPAYLAATASMIGAIALQGPHHTAQKSTRTGSSLLSTSWSNVASLTSRTPTPDMILLAVSDCIQCTRLPGLHEMRQRERKSQTAPRSSTENGAAQTEIKHVFSVRCCKEK